MRRRISLSIALALSVVLLSLMSSDRAANAEPGGMRPIADTGIVPIGTGQTLQLTATGTGFGNNPDNVCFRRIEYGPGTCNADGVCKHAVASQIETAMTTLTRAEGVSFESRTSPFIDGVRVVVLSNNHDVKVNALIINSITNEVATIWLESNY